MGRPVRDGRLSQAPLTVTQPPGLLWCFFLHSTLKRVAAGRKRSVEVTQEMLDRRDGPLRWQFLRENPMRKGVQPISEFQEGAMAYLFPWRPLDRAPDRVFEARTTLESARILI
jgi:hypothetical protein